MIPVYNPRVPADGDTQTAGEECLQVIGRKFFHVCISQPRTNRKNKKAIYQLIRFVFHWNLYKLTAVYFHTDSSDGRLDFLPGSLFYKIQNSRYHKLNKQKNCKLPIKKFIVYTRNQNDTF
ncbi:MAG TPA: hypothetical protein DD657_15120 [Culturomica sp.]|nr:hypothetical protein [Culturomica sp.]